MLTLDQYLILSLYWLIFIMWWYYHADNFKLLYNNPLGICTTLGPSSQSHPFILLSPFYDVIWTVLYVGICVHFHSLVCINSACSHHWFPPTPRFSRFSQLLTGRAFALVAAGCSRALSTQIQSRTPWGSHNPLHEILQLSITVCCMHIQACNSVASKRPF